jgi:peptidoglycan/xylan/chitin deacetylase (PgdA/CDA1 family)/GT2 family glycosyltransferase
LVEDLKEQSHLPGEILIVIGVRPNGRARNRGAERAGGEYVVFIDDDVEIQDPRLIERIVTLFETHPGRVGAAGPSQRLHRDANPFQKRCERQLERVSVPIVEEPLETDMVTHACLAMPLHLYREIGGENDDLPRGTDPDLRFRLRQAGYSIVLVPHTSVGHPPPSSLGDLLRTAFRNGSGSAQVAIHFPHLSLPTAADYAEEVYPPRALLGRGIGWAARAGRALVKGHWVRLSYEASYAAGWFAGRFLEKKRNRIVAKRIAQVPLRTFGRFVSRSPSPALRFLTYHRVSNLKDYPVTVTPVEFERQLEWLTNQGRLVSFERALRVIEGTDLLERDSVALTFDDGYEDNFSQACPILRQFHANACFFLVTDRIGGIGEFGWIRDWGPPNYRILAWEQVLEMKNHGMVFGAHTTRHQRLSSLPAHESRQAMENSIATIREKLGIDSVPFAYPYGRRGDYGRREENYLTELGVKFAFSTACGAAGPDSSRLRLPRINIDCSDTLPTFQAKVLGSFDFMGKWRP